MSVLLIIGLLITLYLVLRLMLGIAHILIDLAFLCGLGFCVLMLLK
jgi:hypothetical protein